MKEIPNKLPSIRGDDEHIIEQMQGSSPPNKAPYKMSMSQQEKIMAQVNELLDKGMIHPRFLTLLLIGIVSVEERWFILYVCGLLCTKQEYH